MPKVFNNEAKYHVLPGKRFGQLYLAPGPNGNDVPEAHWADVKESSPVVSELEALGVFSIGAPATPKAPTTPPPPKLPEDFMQLTPEEGIGKDDVGKDPFQRKKR